MLEVYTQVVAIVVVVFLVAVVRMSEEVTSDVLKVVEG